MPEGTHVPSFLYICLCLRRPLAFLLLLHHPHRVAHLRSPASVQRMNKGGGKG
jgi:hypothetical protein